MSPENIPGFSGAVKNYVRPITRFIFIAGFSVFFIQTAYASWSLYGCCNSICGTENYSSQTACQARLSQGNAICASFGCPGSCTFSGGTCTDLSSGGNVGSGGGNVGSGRGVVFQNIGNTFMGGNGITSGAGGLNSDFGTTRLTGPEQGQATYTSHATTANKQWSEGVNRRSPVLRSLRGEDVPKTTVRYEDRYMARILRRGPESGPGDELREEPVPAELIKGGGQYIGGVGASQGPPDKLPPPSPTGPGQDRGGGDVRCPKDHPYYNDKSGNCYVGPDQCAKDTSRGKASCFDKSAPSAPIAQPTKKQPPQEPERPMSGAPAPGDPARELGEKKQCRKTWWLNPGDNNCYSDEKTCKAASPADAQAVSPAASDDESAAAPVCYQPNP